MPKIDKNHDGFITQNELRNWIRNQHKAINQKHTDKTWSKLNSNGDENLSFDELIDNTIGGLETCSLYIKYYGLKSLKFIKLIETQKLRERWRKGEEKGWLQGLLEAYGKR